MLKNEKCIFCFCGWGPKRDTKEMHILNYFVYSTYDQWCFSSTMPLIQRHLLSSCAHWDWADTQCPDQGTSIGRSSGYRHTNDGAKQWVHDMDLSHWVWRRYPRWYTEKPGSQNSSKYTIQSWAIIGIKSGWERVAHSIPDPHHPF
jgi:hypothetical protein